MFLKRIFPAFALLVLILLAACTEDSLNGPSTEPDMEMEDPEEDNDSTSLTIWDGQTITFTKADGAPPNVEANQDRITDNVWITRGNNGGQIYNAKTESSANKSSSPAGTEWAVGSLDDVENLKFSPFREAVGSPKSVVGKDLVLHLVEDNIYLSVRFLSWSDDRDGGFLYLVSPRN